MSDAARLAVGTLSVLPAPMPRAVDRAVAGRAMGLAPVVGLVLGALAAGVVAAVHALRPDAPLLAAVLGVLTLTGLSGGLHLDGLADTADGLGSRRDRATMLRIMKQGDVGPFGVLTLVGVALVDVAALAACVEAGVGWQAIMVAGTASRLTLPWLCRTGVPPARPDGLGAMVAATVRPAAAALISMIVLAGAVGLTWFTTAQTGPDRTGAVGPAPGVALTAASAVVVAVGTGLLVLRTARRRLGGITGDVLGAAVELALAGALLLFALLT